MLISMHNSGYVMPQPSLCPNDIYRLMVECWKYTPDHRPVFKTLVGRLDEIIQRETEQMYIDLAVGLRRGLSPVEEERLTGE
ncbi:tyrosine-protein kinase SRK3-like [Ruditapes philippinarum]|nr:tyrosine-protein kinase SRK3-like [Ruditapes philippinarum]